MQQKKTTHTQKCVSLILKAQRVFLSSLLIFFIWLKKNGFQFNNPQLTIKICVSISGKSIFVTYKPTTRSIIRDNGLLSFFKVPLNSLTIFYANVWINFLDKLKYWYYIVLLVIKYICIDIRD